MCLLKFEEDEENEDQRCAFALWRGYVNLIERLLFHFHLKFEKHTKIHNENSVYRICL